MNLNFSLVLVILQRELDFFNLWFVFFLCFLGSIDFFFFLRFIESFSFCVFNRCVCGIFRDKIKEVLSRRYYTSCYISKWTNEPKFYKYCRVDKSDLTDWNWIHFLLIFYYFLSYLSKLIVSFQLLYRVLCMFINKLFLTPTFSL